MRRARPRRGPAHLPLSRRAAVTLTTRRRCPAPTSGTATGCWKLAFHQQTPHPDGCLAAPLARGRDHLAVPTASIFAERFSAQGLAGAPERTAADVAGRLLAVQGQDPRGARLAVRARSEGLTAADVDRALSEERSLLITWLNRGTLHLVRSEDYPWLQALTTPPLLTSCTRRLAQEGVPPERGGARREDDRAGARRRGPADPAAAARAARLGRRADRGSGADPPALSRHPARASPCAGRWSARTTPTSSSATGSSRQQPVDREVGPGRAGPPLPGRPRAGGRPRPGPLGRAAAARRARRPGRDRLGAGRARRRPRPPRRPPAGCRGARPAPARRLRPAAARLDLARADPRPAHPPGHHQRHLPALRDGQGPRCRAPGGSTAARSRSSRSAGSPRQATAALAADAADVERFMAGA